MDKRRLAYVVWMLPGLFGCSMDPVSMVVTTVPGVKSKPWCYFDQHQGCPFDELGHSPEPGTYKRLEKCPADSDQLVCPALGPHFSPAPTEADRGTVYVFRESFGFATISPYVYANGVPLLDLAPGGYFVYFAPPGRLELSTQTEASRAVTLDVTAGETYYVVGYFHHNANFSADRADWFQLETESRQQAPQFLKACRLIPADRAH